MTIANMHFAKTNLSKLVSDAVDGKEVFIAKNNIPIIKLESNFQIPKNKIAGLLKGKINVASDFFEEDVEINKMFYGE